MRKRKQGRKFGRESDQRKALLKSLTRALLKHGKIKTTEAKAKELGPEVEKLITKALKGDVAARRMLAKSLSSELVKKIVKEISPKYKDRKGGYTRIIKLGPRKSDSAKMAIIELIE